MPTYGMHFLMLVSGGSSTHSRLPVSRHILKLGRFTASARRMIRSEPLTKKPWFSTMVVMP